MTENKELSKKKKIFIGKVISNKMDKTAVIEIQRTIVHPQYQKVVKRFTRLKAHDQDNQCKIGDQVKIIETRPLSKEKNWKVIDIISSAPQKAKGAEAGE
ncbi:MAG: 30S ribosomal protein S17 [Nitrospirae bacterium]|nr:30S ribosomal protein S17 [Nitrospirota bacterium]MBI3351757.1 30S ribosomal protein S17 [Nitrospirota bacterium]